MTFMSVLAKLLGRKSENITQGMLLFVYKTQQHKISGYNLWSFAVLQIQNFQWI